MPLSFGSNIETQAKLAAIDKSQAVIEFNMDGTIITANANFLGAMGYALEEIQGKHHSLFVTPDHKASPEYAQFWEALNRGVFQAGEYLRVGKDGKEIWIQASYNPLLGRDGKPYKVIKFASDITAQKQQSIDHQGQIDAIGKSQAVIEFNMDGTIIKANENFLGAIGYSLDEIKGQHHRMFVEPNEAASPEYRQFWDQLNRGEYKAAEFKRIAKGGREIWIQASYNPILDHAGKPVKVVKFATDITQQVQDRFRRTEAQRTIDLDLSEITEAVSRANLQATEAAGAATQTSENVQTVAAAVEELASSIEEIKRQVNGSRDIAGQAVDQATTTNQIVSSLSESAGQIGDVVGLISDIAEQTNLLALNATIEAARAGDAGKGFAVVASEVKNLASQTGKATEEISAQISTVQSSTENAVLAIEKIAKIIGEISEISVALSSAVEEQATVTMEMASSMQTAADGVNSISSGTAQIAEATQLIDASTRKVKDASAALG